MLPVACLYFKFHELINYFFESVPNFLSLILSEIFFIINNGGVFALDIVKLFSRIG